MVRVVGARDRCERAMRVVQKPFDDMRWRSELRVNGCEGSAQIVQSPVWYIAGEYLLAFGPAGELPVAGK